MESAAVCDEIVKVYNGKKKVTALDHLSLNIKEGETFGLLGPNGAGKTTLVRIFVTLLKATKGKAEVCGFDVNKKEDKVRQLIGYAGQDSERSAYWRLSVRENLLYFAHALRDVPYRMAKERAEEIANAVGFTDLLDRHFIALSGGEKQLVIVMRAIIHNPQVCFLDEPSKSLDPVTARRVRNFLKEYARKNGITLCITTHNMLEAEEVCDRLALINHGNLLFLGTPTELKRSVVRKEAIEIDTDRLEEDVKSDILALQGVTNVTRSSGIRIYCNDAFNLLPDVIDVMKRSGLKAPVRMVEPTLEEAFTLLVNNDKEKKENA